MVPLLLKNGRMTVAWANGHYEEVEWHINDRDVSRIESGANGGEYTLLITQSWKMLPLIAHVVLTT